MDTALLLVDPYKDFLSDGDKVWPAIKDVAQEVGLLENLRAVVAATRDAGIQVVIVPHRRWQPGDYEGWEFPNRSQVAVGAHHHISHGCEV